LQEINIRLLLTSAASFDKLMESFHTCTSSITQQTWR